MSQCDKYLEMISLYVDGELDESSAAELREHLDKCPECRKYYEVFSIISQSLEETPAPESFASEVMGALREHGDQQAVGAAGSSERRKKKLSRGAIGRIAALAACLALVIAAGIKLATPAADGSSNAGQPAQFAATGADSDSIEDRTTDEYASGEVELAPGSASSDYAAGIDAITVSDGKTVTRIVDTDEIGALVAILEYGEDASGLPEARADYSLEIECEHGTIEMQIYDVDGSLLCVDDNGTSYIAAGSAEDLASELPWSTIMPAEDTSGNSEADEGEG